MLPTGRLTVGLQSPGSWNSLDGNNTNGGGGVSGAEQQGVMRLQRGEEAAWPNIGRERSEGPRLQRARESYISVFSKGAKDSSGESS